MSKDRKGFKPFTAPQPSGKPVADSAVVTPEVLAQLKSAEAVTITPLIPEVPANGEGTVVDSGITIERATETEYVQQARLGDPSTVEGYLEQVAKLPSLGDFSVNSVISTPEDVAAGVLVVDVTLGEQPPELSAEEGQALDVVPADTPVETTSVHKGCQRGGECQYGRCFYEATGHRCEV